MKTWFRLFASAAFTIALLLAVSAMLAATPQAESKRKPQRDVSKMEANITREVRHELIMLPFYSVFDNLAFKVEGDHVTLLGQVTRPSLRSDAEAVVKRIEAVASVTNQIEVLPASPGDDRLRLALYRAIYGNTALQRYAISALAPIRIIVKGGNVTLEGVVATEMDKNLAGIQANSVPGTFRVSNNLLVENQKK